MEVSFRPGTLQQLQQDNHEHLKDFYESIPEKEHQYELVGEGHRAARRGMYESLDLGTQVFDVECQHS